MQALNDALSGRQTGSNSPDSEIEFRPRIWSEASIDFEKEEEEQVTHTDMANERRLQLLESAVLGMSDKFDAVLSAIGSRTDDTPPRREVTPARHVHHSPPRPGRSHHPVTHTTEANNMDDFIQRHLQSEEFSVPRADDGKAFSADFFVTKLIPKPYMYVTRPGLNTIKKKLDARATLTFTEYVVAFLKMIRDDRAKLQPCLIQLLAHLQQVVEDAATREWQAVREWSQGTFDGVERGEYGWDDTHTIQLARLNSAIAATKAPHNIERSDRRDMPCRDFNANSGCQYNKSHMGRNVNFAHICSLCLNQVGEKIPHSAMGCPRAQRVTGALNMPAPRQFQPTSHGGGGQYQHQHQPQYAAYTAKNATGAGQTRMSRQAGSEFQG